MGAPSPTGGNSRMERTSGLAAMMSIIPGDTPAARCWLVLYAAVFLCFTLNLLPVNLAVLAMVAVFLTSPGKAMPYLYFFSFPWAYVAKFDFGLTLSLVQSVIYLARVFMARRALKFSPLEILVLLYLIGQGCFGLLRNGSTTILSFVCYFLIVCHVRQAYFHHPATRHEFLRGMLFAAMVSVGIATLYGYVNGTSLARYIEGLGLSSQMNGTLGTQRFAMCIFIALLYPMYFVENKTWKVSLCVLGTAGILATVSLIALIILGLFWAYYFVMSLGKWRLLLFAAIGICLVLSIGALLWERILANPFLSPMAMRVELVGEQLKSGDMNAATTGRENLLEGYLADFADATLSEQLFGRQFILSERETLRSHNTYLDMMNCIGIFGALLLFLLQISRLREYFKCPERDLLLLMKFVVLLTAATVSILPAQYWQLFLYL